METLATLRAELEALEANFHALVDPDVVIAAKVRALALASAAQIDTLAERIEAIAADHQQTANLVVALADKVNAFGKALGEPEANILDLALTPAPDVIAHHPI